MRGWTFGAEHELADIPIWMQLPRGYGRDVRDITIMNSNGIANDPTGRLYGYGGEINTPPTDDLRGQVDCLREIVALMPMAKVNHRSNLHIHIRVPGLREDLDMLKQVQRYVHLNMRAALRVVEPIDRPTGVGCTYGELLGALRRWRRRRVSHQTLLTSKRLDPQLMAATTKEFFEREVPAKKDGKPMWIAQPRLCVNLRQLLETDTVEFRHFPGTLDPIEMDACLGWCQRFLTYAINDAPILELLEWAREQTFPSFPPYVHWMETRYRATVHDGTVSREDIKRNIVRIEAGEFDEIGVIHVRDLPPRRRYRSTRTRTLSC